MKFFKYVFASALGTIIAGIVMFFILFALIIGVISTALDEFSSDKTVSVKQNSVLILDFDGPINERAVEDDFIIPGFSEKSLGLNQILKTIDKAKKDERIEGIYLSFADIQGGTATTEAIRNALLDFKNSGKWIIAYSEGYSQKGYYLVSTADEIYLNPEGMVMFYGLNYKPGFMKDMFDKIGIEMQVIRGSNNKFKSAV
jgi:protease-4